MNDTTFQGDGKIAFVPVIVNAKPPKQTNADRIRSMTDEELAEFITSPTPQGICKDRCGGDIDYPCSECALVWLKQETSE